MAEEKKDSKAADKNAKDSKGKDDKDKPKKRKKFRNTPAILALLAGSVASVKCLINGNTIAEMLWILIIAMGVFFVAGLGLRELLNNHLQVVEEEKDKEEGEESQEDGEESSENEENTNN